MRQEFWREMLVAIRTEAGAQWLLEAILCTLGIAIALRQIGAL